MTQDSMNGHGSPNANTELPDYEISPSSPVIPAKSAFLTWRRLRFLLILLLICAVAPFGYRAVKSWRAARLISSSERAHALGDEVAAISLMKQALALSPGTAAVQRAAELYNARLGDKPSLERIIARMKGRGSDAGELLGLAELLAASGDYAGVQAALLQLPGHPDRTQALRLAMIQASMAAASGGASAGADSLLAASERLGGSEGGYLRARAAYYLLAAKDASQARRAFGLLLQVAESGSEASLHAWRAASQMALVPDALPGGTVTREEIRRLMALYPRLSHPRPQDEILDADLSLMIDPSSKDTVLRRLEANRAKGDRSSQLEFARWLNAKGLSAEVLRFAGEDRYRNDTDWLLVVLDAKSSRKEWDAVATLLNSPAGAGIPDAVRHLFLARAALVLGKPAEADREWAAVNTALRLEKSETIAYIAAYEEQLGLLDQAGTAYREMALRKETHVKGLVGTIRCQPSNAPAAGLIPLYEQLTASSPEFADAGGDLAYLRMLCWYDIPSSLATAESLLAAQPSSLARISVVALGLLRSGDPSAAMTLYEGKQIDWPSAPLPWRAVRVAVLRASGRGSEADALAATIDPSKLRPEERSLIASQKSPSARKAPPRKS